MNKRQFINELEKRLKVLSDTERNDIINEYSDIIYEKTRNGISEEQAVKEFGNIDSLVKEILESYKINPNYDERFGKKAKNVARDCEGFIKNGAKKLADTTQNVVDGLKNSGNTLTLETIFEIIIKIFIFLIILGILRLPFYIIRELGESVLSGIFLPLDNIFSVIWRIIIWLLYIFCCALVGIVFFKKYFNNYKTEISSNESNTKSDSYNSNENSYVNVDTLHSNNNSDNNTDNNSKSNNVLTILIKVFAIICIFIPLCFTIIGLYSATCISIYFLIKGLPVIGLTITLLGLSLGSSWLFDLFNKILFTKKKIHISLFFVSIILSVIGGIIFTFEILDIDYYNEKPNVDFKTYTENLTIDQNLYIDNSYNNKIIIDETLQDNVVNVSLLYYDEFSSIDIIDHNNADVTLLVNNSQNSTVNIKNFFNIILDDLKNRKLYNYGYLFEGDITIKVNSNTKNKIYFID